MNDLNQKMSMIDYQFLKIDKPGQFYKEILIYRKLISDPDDTLSYVTVNTDFKKFINYEQLLSLFANDIQENLENSTTINDEYAKLEELISLFNAYINESTPNTTRDTNIKSINGMAITDKHDKPDYQININVMIYSMAQLNGLKNTQSSEHQSRIVTFDKTKKEGTFLYKKIDFSIPSHFNTKDYEIDQLSSKFTRFLYQKNIRQIVPSFHTDLSIDKNKPIILNKEEYENIFDFLFIDCDEINHFFAPELFNPHNPIVPLKNISAEKIATAFYNI